MKEMKDKIKFEEIFDLTDIEKTFEQAIEVVRANKSEKNKNVDNDYYKLLELNKKAFENAENEENMNDITTTAKKGSSNAKNIIKIHFINSNIII